MVKVVKYIFKICFQAFFRQKRCFYEMYLIIKSNNNNNNIYYIHENENFKK